MTIPRPASPRRWHRMAALAGAGVLALTLVACGGPEGAAQETAERWMDALNDGDMETARELSTESTRTLLEMGSAMSAAMGGDSAGKGMGPGEYDITAVEMTGEKTARVTVESETGQTQTLDLVRVDGDWKVGFSK